MNYRYNDAKGHNEYPYVYIRLKNERKYYRCEYYDGMRLLFDSVPKDKHRYETRHPDNDVSYPIAIAPEGKTVVVNFCGTIVSDIPIAINEEKKVMVILYSRNLLRRNSCNSWFIYKEGVPIHFDTPSLRFRS